MDRLDHADPFASEQQLSRKGRSVELTSSEAYG